MQDRAGRRQCFMVALDHRSSIDRDLSRLGIRPTRRGRAELKGVIWQGVKAVLPEIPAHGDVAILIERGHDRIVAEAIDANVTVALALEASGEGILRPEAAPDELARDLRAFPGSLGKVLLRWHPDDAASTKGRQLAALHKLADLAEENGRELLLELLVPPAPGDLAGAASGDRYDESRLPRHQFGAITELVDSGLAPALWKLEGHPNAAGARAVASAVIRCDPGSYILVLGGGATIADLARPFSGGAGIDAFNGFAVGRSIWRKPITDLCRHEITEAGARHAIGRNLLAVIDVFDAATSQSG